MMCETVVLLTALAGLPAGTCALKCEMSGGLAITVTGDGCEGQTKIRSPRAYGAPIPTHLIDGHWIAVIEQLPEQCLNGGFSQW